MFMKNVWFIQSTLLTVVQGVRLLRKIAVGQAPETKAATGKMI